MTTRPTFISVIHRGQRVITSRNRCLKPSDDFRNTVLVEFLNCHLKFQTCFAIDEEFSYLGASSMILWFDLSYFPFSSRHSSWLVVNRFESI